MSTRRVLVTGASGFIGSRLVERLALGSDYTPRAMVRQFAGAGLARLARVPTELALADLLDAESLTRAAQGCDVIVHCAYGSGTQNKHATTVDGTRNLLEAASSAGVRKLVYLSTAMVHGRGSASAVVDEDSPLERGTAEYDTMKCDAEELVWKFHREQGLPVVVFRPTLVYGPYDRRWIEYVVQNLKEGALLYDNGSGNANLVYIDNLIDAILLAMEGDAGNGEAFIANDDEPLTWRDIYDRYSERIGDHPPIRSMSVEEIDRARAAGEPSGFERWVTLPISLVGEMARSSFRTVEFRRKVGRIPWMRWIMKISSRDLKDRLKQGNGAAAANSGGAAAPGPAPVKIPTAAQVELFTSPTRFSSEKMKRVLGFRQRVTFEQALDLTEAWLRYQRLIP